jgi:hypothetical protein
MPHSSRCSWIRRLGWLAAMIIAGCVGLPPSPPQQDTESAAGSSQGEPTTTGLVTAGMSSTVEGTNGGTTTIVDDGSTTTLVDEGSTTQGVQPGTSTGELTSTTGELQTGTSTGNEAGSTSTGASPSCNELYGAAPGYILCMETGDECHFSAQTNGGDCNEMCAMFGGVCLAAFDDGPGSCVVVRPNMDTCDTDRATEICACTK